MGELQHITCNGRSRYFLDNSLSEWCCKTRSGADVLETDREDLGLIFFFLTRLSQVLEGVVSRRIGVCLRSQPSKVNGRKPKQMVINEGRKG